MQRRGDQKKSESQSHYNKRNSRLGGRSGSAQPQYQRVTSGKGGGSSVLPPPSPDSSSPTTQSFNKSDGETGPLKETDAVADQESVAVQNDVPATTSGTGSSIALTSDKLIEPADRIMHKDNPIASSALSSQHASSDLDPAAPKTPMKDDTSKKVSLQFGSFTPGFVNGMQIPQRTNSAPPNMDEQKRIQARSSPFRPLHLLPSSAPHQPQQRVDTGKLMNKNPDPQHSLERDLPVQVSATPAVSNMQKLSSLPFPGVPVNAPFLQPHGPVQFGMPGAQVQHQGIPCSSFPMPMPLPVGNPNQVRHPPFVPGLPPHHMHLQGAMQPGQMMNFPPKFAHQPFGNMGVGIPPQFGQYARKVNPRRSVKITHPDTHEELKLDEKVDMKLDGGSSGLAIHHVGGLPAQPMHYGPSRPMNFFPHVPPNPIFLQNAASVPITNSFVAPCSPALGYNSPASVQLAMNQAPGSARRELLTSSFPVPKKTMEIEKALQPPLRVGSYVEEPKILSETSVEASESASKLTPFASPSDKLVVSVDIPPSASATSIGSNANHVRGVEYVDTELKNPPKKSQGHPPQLREEGNSKSRSSPTPPNSVDRISEGQNAETIETQATSTLSEMLNDASICPGASLHNADTRIPDEASEHSRVTTDPGNVIVGKGIRQGVLRTNPSEWPSLGIKNEDTYISMAAKETQTERNSNVATDNDRHASDQVSRADDCETNNVGHQLSHSAASLSDNVSKIVVPACGSSKYFTEDNEFASVAPETRPVAINNKKEVLLSASGAKNHEDSHIHTSPSSPSYTKIRGKVSEETKTEYRPVQGSSPKDKSTNKVKSNSRGKKKRREILQKADAAGDTSDLYMAFKGPKEKPQSSVSSESVESCSSLTARKISSSSNEDFSANEDKRSTGEPNNWEDAAMSTPKLETSGDNKIVNDKLRHPNGGSVTTGKKRYSRDFLLTLSSHFADLPTNFEVPWHMMEALLSPKASISKGIDFNKNDPNPYPGQTNSRQCSSSWSENRPTGMADDGRWTNEQYMDINLGGSTNGARPGRGNHKNMRNLQGQPPSQYVSVFPAGTMLPLASQGGVQHIRSDANRWQRVSGSRKGSNPSHSPLQVMHKADKKYEIRKVTDEEEAKRRHLKAILNKLTPQNFEKLFEQVKEVNIDSATTLAGVISQIFDKALMEPTFCEMYANFCYHLAGELPDFVEDNQKITFKRLLLDKCQEEFERGEREEAEADSMEEDGEVKLSEGKREEKRLQVRRRMLGNIRLIGELYKKKMLTERIMHECIQKLLGQYQTPDEEDIESLCKLMSTIGEMIDHSKAKDYMDAYFDMMMIMANNTDLSSRVRFMLMDIIDLRKNKWQQRRKVEGPKKIEEVRRDAVQERRAQVSRSGRGSSTVSSSRRGQPADLGPRPSMFSSPAPQMTPFRGMPSQNRGFGNQDCRLEAKHPHESRASSAALPQRPIDDKTMSLGPRGVPGRGTFFRGPPMNSGGPVADVHAGFGESRKLTAGAGGCNPASGWSPYNSRQESISKYAPGTVVKPTTYAPPNQHEHGHYAEREETNINRPSGRSAEPPALSRQDRPSAVPNSPGMIWSEERLGEMSIAAIREFYSAVDEDEVALRIGELNSPSFLPVMLSIWVNDSFQRKERDRDLLARLLISLTKSKVVLDTKQLIEGFESVLATLEDEVTDAPKAAVFLGHIFGRLISENVISLKETERLIRHGGEEPGHLLQTGLGYEVLESTFDLIRSEKGESALRDICSTSNTQLEDFRPAVLSE